MQQRGAAREYISSGLSGGSEFRLQGLGHKDSQSASQPFGWGGSESSETIRWLLIRHFRLRVEGLRSRV